MTRDKFDQYAADKKVIIPEAYIDAVLSCGNDPGTICEDYGDINLFSFEEFAEAQEYMNIFEFCPSHLAIGNTGGGEVLLMEQKADANSVVVTGAGNLLPKYWDPIVCRYIDDFRGWVQSGCPDFPDDEDDEE